MAAKKAVNPFKSVSTNTIVINFLQQSSLRYFVKCFGRIQEESFQSRLGLREVWCHMIFVFFIHVVHQIVFCGLQDELGLLNKEYAHIVCRE